VPAADRARELRKIARGLRDLADEFEAGARARGSRRKGKREVRLYRAASGLLMDTLPLGGPQDESLRRVLLSWRTDPVARWRCFQHVCQAWRPLPRGRVVPSTADLMSCADALRMIARGVAGASEENAAGE
jgi:hypothetical protein